MPLTEKPRRTITTSSPSRGGRVIVSSPKSTTSRARFPMFLTATLIFISGLQISHPLYKHLLKHNVTRTSKVLSRAQSYIQLEKSIESSVNHSLKRNNYRKKMNSHHVTLTRDNNKNRGEPPSRNKLSRISCQVHYKPDRVLYSAEAPHQRGLKHNQRTNYGSDV